MPFSCVALPVCASLLHERRWGAGWCVKVYIPEVNWVMMILVVVVVAVFKNTTKLGYAYGVRFVFSFNAAHNTSKARCRSWGPAVSVHFHQCPPIPPALPFHLHSRLLLVCCVCLSICIPGCYWLWRGLQECHSASVYLQLLSAGVAVSMMMLGTTFLVFLVMLTVWELHLVIAVPFLLFFAFFDGVYVSSNLNKIPHGVLRSQSFPVFPPPLDMKGPICLVHASSP
jgi:K+ potassium transporter